MAFMLHLKGYLDCQVHNDVEENWVLQYVMLTFY